MMNKTLLLLGMGLVSIGLLSPASATQRYLNSDGMPNYSQLSSNTNGNQLSASMWDGLVAGLNTTSSRFFQLVTAINQSLTELSTKQEQHFSQVKTQMSSMDAYLRAHLPVQCSTGATPDPINGKCGTTLGGCTNGTPAIISITAECGQKSIWNCNGLHGGSNVSCEASNPACSTPETPQAPVTISVNSNSSSFLFKLCQEIDCKTYSQPLKDSYYAGNYALYTGENMNIIRSRGENNNTDRILACVGIECKKHQIDYKDAYWDRRNLSLTHYGNAIAFKYPYGDTDHILACVGTECKKHQIDYKDAYWDRRNLSMTVDGDILSITTTSGLRKCKGTTCNKY